MSLFGPREVHFKVVGVPATQGSMKGYVVGGRARVTNSNTSRLAPWREAVRSGAVIAMGEAWRPFEGPVEVRLSFALPKPSGAPKSRRTWPIGARAGDVDKLARGCLDALTDSGIWRDDSQVVRLHAEKDYPQDAAGHLVPGCIVIVREVESNA